MARADASGSNFSVRPGPPAAANSIQPSDLVAQNAETMAAVRARAEQPGSHHQRAIERATAIIGRPGTLYAVLLAVACWVVANLVVFARTGRALDPPPFPWLQGVIGLCALLTAIMVLATQNRQTRHAEQRSHLDLQVNLSAEQKTAKLIALLEELRRDLPNVPNRRDVQAEAMTAAVDPHEVMTALEQTFEIEPTSEPESDEDSSRPSEADSSRPSEADGAARPQ